MTVLRRIAVVPVKCWPLGLRMTDIGRRLDDFGINGFNFVSRAAWSPGFESAGISTAGLDAQG